MRRAPGGIFTGHTANQITDFLVDGRSSGFLVLGFPLPEEREAHPMPSSHGVGFDDAQNRAPIGPEAREPDPEASVSGPQLGSFHRVFEHAELLPEGEILGGQGGAADDERPQQEIQSFDQSH
jgi:hypothetical protein